MAGPSVADVSASVPRFDVFLSYNSRDQAVVEQIAQRLRSAGLKPWLDRWSLTPGGEWQRELAAGLDAAAACAVFVGPHDLGAWELQELALALDRAARERSFRLFPVLLPGVEEPFEPNRLPHFLRARTWVDLRRGHEDSRALQDLANAVRGVPLGPPATASAARVDDVAPYRGLRAFGEEDAALFFGRDGEIQRLLEKLKSSRFVAVLGPSGSGKSSLVRAGLVPRLRAGALTEGGGWRVCVLRPGAAPLTTLAAQLAILHPGRAMQATLDGLEQDPRSVHLSVELALAERSADERVVVVVDQLEEVFTLCRDESQRRQLFANLVYATSAAGGRAVVVVTLRADFYMRCADYPEFAQLLAAQQMLVGPMDTDGLRQAIQEPARRTGLRLEDGLADTILTDVAAEPGALPLLQHALLEVWRHRDAGTLTLSGYRRSGGVHGALAQRAEEIYGQLSVEQQQIARRTLLRLTQPGEGTEDTRRRAPRSELAPPRMGTDNSFDEVLGRLVDARLLTTGRDETGVEIIDVSHEALVRGWPRLRGWIDAGRQNLVVHRRLTLATAEWIRLEGDPSALYRGPRLAEAQALRDRDPDALNGAERAFLDASAEREEAARRKELDDARELAAAQRRAKRGYALVALIFLGAVVAATALTIVAFSARNDAQRQRDNEQRQTAKATSLALMSAASSLLQRQPDVSLLLALEAYQIRPLTETRSSVLAALTEARDPGVLAILHGHADVVSSVAFSPDGRTLASAGGDNTVRLWDARTRRQLGAPLSGHTAFVSSVAFSPDGRTLASAGIDRTVRLWDARTHTQLGAPLRGHTSYVRSVAFSRDGRTLASAGVDRTVRLWDARTRRQIGAPLEGHTAAVVDVAFSPDGWTLASAGIDRTVRLWDVRTRRQLGASLEAHTAAGCSCASYGMAFSPDGRTLASTSPKTIRLWDVRTHRQLGAPLKGHTSGVAGVAFSPNGRTLASAGGDKTVRLWDVRTHRQLGAPLKGHASVVVGVAFSPNGRTLASAGGDKTVRLWNPRTPEQLGPLRGHTSRVVGVAFSPNGRTLASTSTDKTVRLWDARTHRQLGAPLAGHLNAVVAAAFSPDGRTLVSASYDRTVRLWDARTHKQLGAPLTGHTSLVYDVAFSRDGRTLASAGADRTVRLWDARTRRQIGAPLEGHTAAVTSVAFSPDGRTLASAGADRTVWLWDVRTHKQLGQPLAGHTEGIERVAFSPDGRTVASAGHDRTVRLWDARTHKQLGAPLEGHTDAVAGVAFSPDGRTLASAGYDKTVRLWNTRTHPPLGAPLTGHTKSVYRVAFSPDGRTLASASADKTVRLWDGLLWRNFTELQIEVCKLVGGGLSKSEWAHYVAGISYRNSCR